jgi:hypothetical protein
LKVVDNMDEIFPREAEIEKKNNLQQQLKKEQEKKGIYCKICGKFVEPISQEFIERYNSSKKITAQSTKNISLSYKKCSHCKISLCNNCSSCGFCLNCFTNMHEDARKTLKLFKNLIWSIPVFTFFLMFQGILEFILIELFLIGLFIGLFFYTKRTINVHGLRYFNPKWETKIKHESFTTYLNPFNPKKYVDQTFLRAETDKQKIKINHLKNWINSEDYSDVPIPTHIQNELKSMDKDILNIKDSGNLSINEQTNEDGESKKIPPSKKINDAESSIKENITHKLKKYYKLIDKKCPNCNEIIKFADFCPTCNVRFCPLCNIDNNPYNKICICSYKFTPLQEEYIAWAGTDEVEFVKSESKK